MCLLLSFTLSKNLTARKHVAAVGQTSCFIKSHLLYVNLSQDRYKLKLTTV